MYNSEDAFKLTCIRQGLPRADQLQSEVLGPFDGKIEWPPDAQGDHPLADFLLADFPMAVDVSKPSAEDSYLEIERKLLKGSPHQTFGGRDRSTMIEATPSSRSWSTPVMDLGSVTVPTSRPSGASGAFP